MRVYIIADLSVGLVADQRCRLCDSRATEDQPDPMIAKRPRTTARWSFAHAFAEARSDGEAGDHGGRRGGRRRGEADVYEGPSAPAAVIMKRNRLHRSGREPEKHTFDASGTVLLKHTTSHFYSNLGIILKINER